MLRLSASGLPSRDAEEERLIPLTYSRGRSVVSICETNVDVSVCALHIILSETKVVIEVRKKG